MGGGEGGGQVALREGIAEGGVRLGVRGEAELSALDAQDLGRGGEGKEEEGTGDKGRRRQGEK